MARPTEQAHRRKLLLVWQRAAGVLLLLALAGVSRPALAEPGGFTAGTAHRAALTEAAGGETGHDEYLMAAAMAEAGADTSCRFGVGTDAEELLPWVPVLGAGWFLDFGVRSHTAPAGTEYVPVIRIEQGVHLEGDHCVWENNYSVWPPLTELGLGAYVASMPGALWLIGNEPDRGPNPLSAVPQPAECEVGQDSTMPAVYAEAYHEVSQFVRQRDPTAQLGMAGLVEVSPGRLQYLDLVWDAYQARYGEPIPVDVWNMHLYILAEAESSGKSNGLASIALGTDPALAIRSPDLASPVIVQFCAGEHPGYYCYTDHDNLSVFVQQILDMRSWMAAHGQRHKPLILSEYSLLLNSTVTDEFGRVFTAARAEAFLRNSVSFLRTLQHPALGYPLDGNRLVQQWLWYALVLHPAWAGDVSSLLTDTAPATLTQVGRAYSETVRSAPIIPNLVIEQARGQAVFTSEPGGTVTVTLTVTLANNGDTAVTAPFAVAFYADSALSIPIGQVAVSPPLAGCSRQLSSASITWSGLGGGAHQYWVEIDSGHTVPEANDQDNVATAIVLVNPQYSLYLPLVSHTAR